MESFQKPRARRVLATRALHTLADALRSGVATRAWNCRAEGRQGRLGPPLRFETYVLLFPRLTSAAGHAAQHSLEALHLPASLHRTERACKK